MAERACARTIARLRRISVVKSVKTEFRIFCPVGWRLTLVKQLEAQPAEMAIARDLVVADDPEDLGGQADPER